MSRVIGSCVCLLAVCSICRGQAVQLPRFHRFSATSSVRVPDRGGAVLGGVSRSASMRGTSGLSALGRLGRNTAISRMSGSSSASVHVTVHDFEAMDRAILAKAAARRRPASVQQRRAAAIEHRLASAAADAQHNGPFQSVAAIRRQQQLQQQTLQEEASAMFADGLKAEQAGKPGAARIYYKMAARRATGALRRDVLRQLAQLKDHRPPVRND